MHEPSTHENEKERTTSQFKAMIIAKAQTGTFDNNPLLSTVHVITCPKCQHRRRIVYLDYLKNGEFVLGKVEQIEVLDTSGPIGLLEMEQMTSIIISLICIECGHCINIRPVSAEYVHTIITRPKVMNTFFA